MNYYEQFYDDLEFCDPVLPVDDLHTRHDPYYDRYYRDDPYYDRYYRDDPYYDRYYRDDPYNDRYYIEDHYEGYRYESNYYYRHRPIDPNYERQPPLYEGQRDYYDRQPLDPYDGRHIPMEGGCVEDDQQERQRGRGISRVRGLEGRGNAVSTNRGQGRGKVQVSSDRGQGRGMLRGAVRGVNFVKAGAVSAQSSSSNSDENKLKTGITQLEGKETQGGNTKPSESDQIRFDYKKYQNEKTETEKEVEEALKVYKCQLGFGYGYGPRSDLLEGEPPEWIIGSEAETVTSEASVAIDGSDKPAEVNKVGPKPVVKKAMVSPALNFVKANSEFHSIDVAFHENLTAEEKPKANSLSVNFGNKRVGLGFGVSTSKGNVAGVDISEKFHAGMKNGCNAQMDAKFAGLHKAVKAKSLPNKNGIEIMHMAVDRVKMVISDEITSSGRTPTGQPKFKCTLAIDGVFVSEGIATAKKAAKHEAYHNALKVFANEALTVKEVSQGVFELRPKEIVTDIKAPKPIGPALGTKPINSKPVYVAAQKSQTNTSQPIQSTSQPAPPSQSSTVNYSKPKIVFHQSSQPSPEVSNKLLEFRNAESLHSQTACQFSAKKAEDMAMKLLHFVKEEKIENQSASSTSQVGSKVQTTVKIEPALTSSHSSSVTESRKRSSGHLSCSDSGRFKVQKKGGNMLHSLDDLTQFILIDNSPICSNLTELSILHQSANFNKVILKLEYDYDLQKNDVRCSLALSDIIVTVAHGNTKEEAKLQAAIEALDYLKECCYTIVIKQQVDSDVSGLTKEQLLSDIQKANDGGNQGDNVIPDSNIGNMLLRKMGWVGGGVGKDGKGIAEPVKTEMIIGRQGLGLDTRQGTGGNFKKRVTKMLEDYIKTDEQNDLHFSSELTKEERAVIHTIGQKMGLKTQSKGKDDDRYLIVSRKRSPQQLLEHVMESGGSTSRYELIPPRDSDLDILRREDITHGHCKQ